jgi:nitrogen PTS system EIIA component
MLLSAYVAEKNILLDMQPADKTEAVEQLARLLLRGRADAVTTATIQQLLTREAIESTGIGHGIAIPHARVAGLKDLVCAVGRLATPLDFRSVDRQPVHFIFLICYPPDRQTLYLNFVSTLARLLHEETHVDCLRQAESPAEMFERLEEISGVLVRPEVQFATEPIDGPSPQFGDGSSPALVLLARLELCEDMLTTARTDRSEIERRIENISSLLDPHILEHYRRLKRRPGPAVVVVEGRVCQGCLMMLPPQFVQDMRRQRRQIHLCSHCRRFIYQI